jgi:hypothetical protein
MILASFRPESTNTQRNIRLNNMREQEDEESESWGTSSDALVIVSGTSDDEVIRFPKSSAVQVGERSLDLLD